MLFKSEPHLLVRLLTNLMLEILIVLPSHALTVSGSFIVMLLGFNVVLRLVADLNKYLADYEKR